MFDNVAAAPVITNTTSTVVSSPVSIVGTAEANSVVELFKGETSLGTATADNLGAFTFSSVALAEGANSFTAKATDRVGNTSPASPAVVITLNTPDTTPPAAPAITNSTGIVASSPVKIIGTAEANSIVELFKGETSLGTVTADNLGAFTFSNVVLAEGNNSFTATATDAANNTSVASSVITITFDTTYDKIRDNTEFSISTEWDDFPDPDTNLKYFHVTISDIETDDKFALSNGNHPELTASQNGQDLKWSDALTTSTIVDGTAGKKNFVFTFDYYGACMVDTEANVDFRITFRDSDNSKVGLETFLIG